MLNVMRSLPLLLMLAPACASAPTVSQSLAAASVDEPIAQDRKQPDAQVRTCSEAVARTPGALKGVLHEII